MALLRISELDGMRMCDHMVFMRLVPVCIQQISQGKNIVILISFFVLRIITRKFFYITLLKPSHLLLHQSTQVVAAVKFAPDSVHHAYYQSIVSSLKIIPFLTFYLSLQ